MGAIVQAVIFLFLFAHAADVATPTASPSTSPPPAFFVTPDQLKWTEYRAKGWAPGSASATVSGDPNKPCGWITRYRMPDGYRVPVHKDSNTEEATVMTGAFVFGVGALADRARTTTLPMGSYVRIERGVPHYGWALGETILEIRPICPTK